MMCKVFRISNVVIPEEDVYITEDIEKTLEQEGFLEGTDTDNMTYRVIKSGIEVLTESEKLVWWIEFPDPV